MYTMTTLMIATLQQQGVGVGLAHARGWVAASALLQGRAGVATALGGRQALQTGRGATYVACEKLDRFSALGFELARADAAKKRLSHANSLIWCDGGRGVRGAPRG